MKKILIGIGIILFFLILPFRFINPINCIKSENRKIDLNCKISIRKGHPVKLNVTSENDLDIYSNLDINCKSDIIAEEAKNKPLDKERILSQLNKTTDSMYQFKNIEIDLDNNVFLPKISALNELRRTALESVYNFAVNNIKKQSCEIEVSEVDVGKIEISEKQFSVLLNVLNLDFDYSKLENIDNIYIPLKYFSNTKYSKILEILSNKLKLYIYMPTIIKANYRNLFYNNIEKTIEKYNIKGFVVSNISNLKILEDITKNNHSELIANYTFNIFNNYSVSELKNLGLNRFTISPESDMEIVTSLCNNSLLNKEMIVYGNTPLMNMNYCLNGKTNKCYPTCTSKCNSDNKYFLNDRKNMKFRVIFDNIQTVSTIYNSKITSICSNDFDINCSRIDILDETIDDINFIVSQVKDGKRLEGKEYTNGNLNREI